MTKIFLLFSIFIGFSSASFAFNAFSCSGQTVYSETVHIWVQPVNDGGVDAVVTVWMPDQTEYNHGGYYSAESAPSVLLKIIGRDVDLKVFEEVDTDTGLFTGEISIGEISRVVPLKCRINL